MKFDHAILVGLDVRAMVAAEHNHQSLLVLKVLQSIALAVNGFEIEINCLAS